MVMTHKERYMTAIDLGELDAVPVDATHVDPIHIERITVKKVLAARGGGFILADSNSLHSNVKTESILVMIDEARKYGCCLR
jgi:hypothetical protein